MSSGTKSRFFFSPSFFSFFFFFFFYFLFFVLFCYVFCFLFFVCVGGVSVKNRVSGGGGAISTTNLCLKPPKIQKINFRVFSQQSFIIPQTYFTPPFQLIISTISKHSIMVLQNLRKKKTYKNFRMSF